MEFVFAGADDIDADDVGIDVTRWRDADHLWEKRIIFNDQLYRNATRPNDFLAVIHVVQKGIHRLDPLPNPANKP